ncbi:MAG TPA: LysM peptidoglycan-binding domain-containing protein, partial [Candidatus Hydrogenedentes bacterium]|nr:LysM peptidoglycan-binding domain-containing protein [Candidatus Hydrogenedentota bacterium]
PAILLITEMAKTMAILEEDRGELFMDPLRDTLSRTEESQSLYLTGSAGTAKSRERGDWILSEVRRLVEEAELMEKAERKIEAGAIAALAEARGLCLKSAAQADVPQEAPEILPQPEIPAEIPEGEGPEGELVPEGESAAPEVEMEVQPELKPQPAPEKKKSVKEEKPEEKAESTVSTPEEGIHVVVAGDNPYDIARKYKIKLDDLLKWNQLTKKSTIHIGQKLIIRAAPEE